MTIAELFDQAKALSPQERKTLAIMLIDTLDTPSEQKSVEVQEHWGENLVSLIEELGPVELIHPEIEDPVEWVKQIRREQRQKRLGDWGEEE